ncbi:MAG: tetratricopeptide repeat protein [bacterium]
MYSRKRHHKGLLLALSLFLFLPQQENYANLARIEPVPFRSLQLKSGVSVNNAERLFYEGMASYVKKDYAGAVKSLLQAVSVDSTDADFYFYLGLSYLLSDQIDPAILYLQQAANLAGGSVQEKAYWYLGNAWLVKEEPELALQAFRKVVEIAMDYQWDAAEIIGEIENLKPE